MTHTHVTAQEITAAAEATARLRDDEPPFALAANEAICPGCRLAYVEATGSWGVCSACIADALTRCPF